MEDLTGVHVPQPGLGVRILDSHARAEGEVGGGVGELSDDLPLAGDGVHSVHDPLTLRRLRHA